MARATGEAVALFRGRIRVSFDLVERAGRVDEDAWSVFLNIWV